MYYQTNLCEKEPNPSAPAFRKTRAARHSLPAAVTYRKGFPHILKKILGYLKFCFSQNKGTMFKVVEN